MDGDREETMTLFADPEIGQGMAEAEQCLSIGRRPLQMIELAR
ncbi:MAG: hypothetical protein PVH18_10860 [Chloroflexota bacterium]|jgi:hypothetical protein